MERFKGSGHRTRLLNCLIQQERAFQKYAPNISRQGVLTFYTIASTPLLTLTDLSDTLGIHKRTVSELVKSLALPERPRHTLVCYVNDPSGDRRKKRIQLTKRGEKLIQDLEKIFHTC